MTPLTAEETAMLDLEAAWWQRPGSKEQAIRDRFGWTPTRYQQRLTVLLEREEALAAAPVIVKRLRALKARRTQARQRLMRA